VKIKSQKSGFAYFVLVGVWPARLSQLLYLSDIQQLYSIGISGLADIAIVMCSRAIVASELTIT